MTETKHEDVGDEIQVKKRKSRIKLEQERKNEALRNFLQDPNNREVVYDFLTAMGLFDTLAYMDDKQMSVRVGRREAALWWKQLMDSVDENAFILMQWEAIQRKENNG